LYTDDGVYVSDILSDDEILDILCENITPLGLHTRRILEAEERDRIRHSQHYSERYTEIFSKLGTTLLKRLKIIAYNNSRYALTYETTDLNEVTICRFEHICSVNTYFTILKSILKKRESTKRPRGRRGAKHRQELATANHGRNKSRNR
jgi:hypothetical protein